MTSAPSKTVTNKTVNNKTGVTTSHSVTKSGGSTTITNTKTIGKAAPTSSKPSTSTPSKAAGVAVDSRWIVGPNTDGWTMCGPVAIANALLAATGVEATNTDIERLYRNAGGWGDQGAPLIWFLRAAANEGLAGERLGRYSLSPDGCNADLVLLNLNGLADVHAAAIVNDGRDAVMWGAAIPLTALNATVLNAWSLTWHGEVTS